MKWFSICAVLFLLAPELPAIPQASGSVIRSQDEFREAAAKNQGEVQRALALEQQGSFTEALAAWESVVKAQPRNAQAFAHLGLLEARQEHYSEAITHYRKAQSLSRAEGKPIPQLNLNLGLALFKSAQFHEAATVFQSDLKSRPDDLRLKTLIAMSHYGAREYSAAIPYLKEAAAADQNNLPLRLTLAHCYLWTKQLDATLAVYREILLINPDSAEADMIAGEALDEKGDNTGAVDQFRAAAKANPKEPNVHFGLAYLLWAQKRYDEAIPEFQAELANDPRNTQARIYLGDTYMKQNQFDLARQALEESVKELPAVPLIHLDLGIVYMETGNQEIAARELSKAISLEPDNVTAHFRLAKLYQAMGKRDEAKAEFAKASTLNKKTDEGLHKRIEDANARPAPAAPPVPQSSPDTPRSQP